MRSAIQAGNVIFQSRRCLCSTSSRCIATNTKIQTCAPEDPLTKPVEIDMIGAPDPVSNIRPVKYYVRPNESNEEKAWRLKQQSVDDFNQEFWSRNNAMFAEAKSHYESQLLARNEPVTAEAMSAFYKDFLDKAYGRQMAYNQAWWKHNTAMLLPGLKAAFRTFWYPQHRVDRVKTGFWEKSFES